MRTDDDMPAILQFVPDRPATTIPGRDDYGICEHSDCERDAIQDAEGKFYCADHRPEPPPNLNEGMDEWWREEGNSDAS